MNRSGRRRWTEFRPRGERFEDRLLLSAVRPPAFLDNPPGVQVIRPNTPVLPFASSSKVATFIDPTVHTINGAHVVVGQKTFVGPFVTLNARTGFIKIGTNADIQDNSTIVASPNAGSPTSVLIGDSVVVGFGAVINGPSVIGAYGKAAKPTSIGPNALIDGATIEPGAIVGALARVGPGVTVKGTWRVLPGANVTTDAEASNPKLGKVVKVTTSDTDAIKKDLSDSAALAAGYTTLYQGNSATGANPGTTSSSVFNGNLATVEGSSQEPGSPTVSFEPSGAKGPQFPTPRGFLAEGDIPTFRARVVGQVIFHQRAFQVAHHLGHANAIRADEGQPITFGSITQTGNHVSINSPVGGKVAIGDNFQGQDGAVILGGPTASTTLGNNVTIGAGAVVKDATIGNGATIGPRAYVSGSTVAAGATVPPGEILINNKVVGTVQW